MVKQQSILLYNSNENFQERCKIKNSPSQRKVGKRKSRRNSMMDAEDREAVLSRLRELFEYKIEIAASHMGIGVSRLKAICRQNNISRWPYRKLQSIDRRVAELKVSLEECGNSDSVRTVKKRDKRIQSIQNLKWMKTQIKLYPEDSSRFTKRDIRSGRLNQSDQLRMMNQEEWMSQHISNGDNVQVNDLNSNSTHNYNYNYNYNNNNIKIESDYENENENDDDDEGNETEYEDVSESLSSSCSSGIDTDHEESSNSSSCQDMETEENENLNNNNNNNKNSKNTSVAQLLAQRHYNDKNQSSKNHINYRKKNNNYKKSNPGLKINTLNLSKSALKHQSALTNSSLNNKNQKNSNNNYNNNNETSDMAMSPTSIVSTSSIEDGENWFDSISCSSSPFSPSYLLNAKPFFYGSQYSNDSWNNSSSVPECYPDIESSSSDNENGSPVSLFW